MNCTIVYFILFLLCVVTGSIGRRLQGGLIDRIFYGKKNKWVMTETQQSRPSDVPERERAGSFGTTKARILYSVMLSVSLIITLFLINPLNHGYQYLVTFIMSVMLLWVGQTCGAFGSLQAGFVIVSKFPEHVVTFDKKLAVKHFVGLSMMGYCYCVFPCLLIICSSIVTKNYYYLVSLLVPLLWYFGYYFAWKYPVKSDLFEIQVDDPLPMGELLTGSILGLMVFLSALMFTPLLW